MAAVFYVFGLMTYVVVLALIGAGYGLMRPQLDPVTVVLGLILGTVAVGFGAVIERLPPPPQRRKKPKPKSALEEAVGRARASSREP